MGDPNERPPPDQSTPPPADSAQQEIDDADAAIAWYLSEEFEEHLDRCFAEGKRKALEELEQWRAANELK